MREYMDIGSTPHEEDCAQVGSEGYAKRARQECALFAKQIIKHYGEPEHGYLTIKGHVHDFGTYYEVRVCYDDEDEESTNWAFDIEGDTKGVLTTWDAEFHPINKVLEGESK
jgi:hypothetical protein